MENYLSAEKRTDKIIEISIEISLCSVETLKNENNVPLKFD